MTQLKREGEERAFPFHLYLSWIGGDREGHWGWAHSNLAYQTVGHGFKWVQSGLVLHTKKLFKTLVPNKP
jgi:hypothetical protein